MDAATRCKAKVFPVGFTLVQTRIMGPAVAGAGTGVCVGIDVGGCQEEEDESI